MKKKYAVNASKELDKALKFLSNENKISDKEINFLEEADKYIINLILAKNSKIYDSVSKEIKIFSAIQSLDYLLYNSEETVESLLNKKYLLQDFDVPIHKNLAVYFQVVKRHHKVYKLMEDGRAFLRTSHKNGNIDTDKFRDLDKAYKKLQKVAQSAIYR